MIARVRYNLAPEPRWPLFGSNGLAAANAYMLTWEANDHSIPKAVFEDQNGFIAWPEPVPWAGNGMSEGPFFWADDSNYFIQVYDRDGFLLWEQDNYNAQHVVNPTTSTNFINNLIVNGQLYYPNHTTTPLTVFVANTFYPLAPGATEFLYGSKAAIGFIKNNITATDTIVFVPFAEGDTTLLSEGSPPGYYNFTCSVAGTGETEKDVYFPMTANVQALQQQSNIQIDIQLKSATPGVSVEVFFVQFFGDGPTASPSVFTSVGTYTLTSVFTKYSLSIPLTVPSTAGKSISFVGSDANFIVLRLPLNQLANVGFVNTACYQTSNVLNYQYIPQEQLAIYITKSKTGDIKVKLGQDANYMPGWIVMDDKTIGDTGSTATGRANDDTWNLFAFLYLNVNDTFAPVSGGRSGATLATAATDFAAHKRMGLPKTTGRVLGCHGSNTINSPVVGEWTGSDEHTMTMAELVAHTHTFNAYAGTTPNAATAPGAAFDDTFTNGATTDSTGGTTAFSIVQASIYMNFYIKL